MWNSEVVRVEIRSTHVETEVVRVEIKYSCGNRGS